MTCSSCGYIAIFDFVKCPQCGKSQQVEEENGTTVNNPVPQSFYISWFKIVAWIYLILSFIAGINLLLNAKRLVPGSFYESERIISIPEYSYMGWALIFNGVIGLTLFYALSYIISLLEEIRNK